MDSLTAFIGLAVAGIVIGMFSGLLGIGGGTVMVPTLRLVFGLSAQASTATSLFAMVFTSISGTTSHIQQKTSIPILGLALGIGGALTSPLGVWLNARSPSWTIMLATAAVICWSAWTMFSKARKLPKTPRKSAAPAPDPATAPDPASAPDPATAPDSASAPDPATAPEPDPAPPAPTFRYNFTPARLAGALGSGMLAGLSAGYIGVGGGFVMVPLMTAFLGVPMRMASGTSLVAIVILSIPGIAEQIAYGNVDFLAGIALAVGSIPGAAIGARFVKWIPERELRYIFAAFLLVAAIALVVNEVTLL